MNNVAKTVIKSTDDVIELQTKIAYMEDMIETLNDVVAIQTQEIQRLNDKLKLLYTAVEKGYGHEEVSAFDLLADRPPHY